jgi:stearoyl-CoA desaturase (Delta-9 desaturase)
MRRHGHRPTFGARSSRRPRGSSARLESEKHVTIITYQTTLPETHADDDAAGVLTNPSRRKKTIESPYIHRLQLRHFVLFEVLPAAGTALAVALLFFFPVGRIEVLLFGAMWLITGVGITVGYHRLFTHRSFKAVPALRAALAVSGAMAGQGGVLSWVALHRRHHEYSDLPGDPHSPNLHGSGFVARSKGLLHAHFTWMMRHDYPSIVHYVPDLLREREVVKIDQYYYPCTIVGFALPALLGGLLHQSLLGALLGLLWGGAVRMFILGNIIWSINSVLHHTGTRRFATREHSHNGAAACLLTLGESWHNNHHAFPHSASFGLEWFRLDPGYWCIALLKMAGLAYDVKRPSADKILERQRSLARASTKPSNVPSSLIRRNSEGNTP